MWSSKRGWSGDPESAVPTGESRWPTEDDHHGSSAHLAQRTGFHQGGTGLPGLHTLCTLTPGTCSYSLTLMKAPPEPEPELGGDHLQTLCVLPAGVRGLRPDRVHSRLHLHHTWRLDLGWVLSRDGPLTTTFHWFHVHINPLAWRHLDEANSKSLNA